MWLWKNDARSTQKVFIYGDVTICVMHVAKRFFIVFMPFVTLKSIIMFVVWTLLIQLVDVQPSGQNGTNIGFASFNT